PTHPPIYTTCLHCHADLGANETLDHFPVGRRLAFDQRRGRLWVVCTTCARWNLSPLDERWEVIESCERLYRDSPKRLSSDQVGLAKLKEGIVLVRIGDPVFPEYASWRYGRVFTRRDQSALFTTGAGIAAVVSTLLLMGGPVAVLSGAGATAYATYRLGRAGVRAVTGLRRLGPIPLADGSTQLLDVARARRARIARTDAGAWTLAVPEYRTSTGLEKVEDELTDEERADGFGLTGGPHGFDLVAPGEAELVARRVMPVVNAAGGDDEMVRGASKLHEQWEGRIGETVSQLVDFQRRPLALAGEPHLSLAFEMSVYEEQEQRWLQTELYLLKAAWKEAERLAAIADGLTVPEWVEERIDVLKRDPRIVTSE
ncbi:MAG TPA: hypothetical protein VFI13_09935, partial [Gemmatimonadales bacterium]|nr:hypothetical protein [Gemmatimonadales bacterium]